MGPVAKRLCMRILMSKMKDAFKPIKKWLANDKVKVLNAECMLTVNNSSNLPGPVFYITAFFPKPTGATYSAIRLARALRNRGVDIFFVVERYDDRWSHEGFFEKFPVRSFRLSQPGKLQKFLGLVRFSQFIISQRSSFDIFHIHGGGYVNFFIGWWVRWITGRKVLLKITSDGWDTPDGAFREKYGPLVRFFYRYLDGVVAMTSGQEKKCMEWGFPGLLKTIPNGVDCSRYIPVDMATKKRLREEKGLPVDSIVLCYVGWLGQRKGTDVLFEVWAELRRKYSNLVLLCVGDYLGKLKTPLALNSFLSEHGIDPETFSSPDIIMVGHVKDAEKYLQASDIFIFPSRREGFGTVQTEAMACGLPCVVNDLPGVSCDIYPDESVGFRVKDNKIDDYVRICADLIKHPEKRAEIGSAARERVVRHFSLETVAEKYLEFYKKLLLL